MQQGVEVLDLRRHLHLIIRGVESGDRADASLAGDQPLPKAVQIVANRRYGAHAGNHNSVQQNSSLPKAAEH